MAASFQCCRALGLHKQPRIFQHNRGDVRQFGQQLRRFMRELILRGAFHAERADDVISSAQRSRQMTGAMRFHG